MKCINYEDTLVLLHTLWADAGDNHTVASVDSEVRRCRDATVLTQSSGSDSGINYSVWKTLTGYDKAMDQEKPGPIKYDQACLAFAESNGAAPTYADVLWSNVPQDSSSPVPGTSSMLCP